MPVNSQSSKAPPAISVTRPNRSPSPAAGNTNNFAYTWKSAVLPPVFNFSIPGNPFDCVVSFDSEIFYLITC
ncbi:hypothetical protein PRUPE_1G292200 [Prunus persica]|uniref:Uncharacterized protein n=1 Tax=Prunus persica TaxID=3760 RepID=A0A251R503_PRUPE|nr:hypothetical protein PRUPE_1G292200 [Prunus persica]